MTGILANHIAVVTGGASGIGRAIALGYAREGAHVAVLDANAEGAEATSKAIIAAGGKALSLKLDVTQRDRCREPGLDPREQRRNQPPQRLYRGP